ncbi:hypothetical protein A2Y99_05040 [Candidatus Gottesmanbacteria bacterium RBG_13_37_7]|uniref:Uncharacterized protein n=1 Tax=Candidatus Gottesmanbacteria bacterium RBG_13_37_7 TaxID=1798369 RepID=A0A1F5YGL7_9BACT|nr:MAG: hypothetical protein A2Y99_05040 [Candidatus Gottesmanbacteria bacterium RBG_13_37_7]
MSDIEIYNLGLMQSAESYKLHHLDLGGYGFDPKKITFFQQAIKSPDEQFVVVDPRADSVPNYYPSNLHLIQPDMRPGFLFRSPRYSLPFTDCSFTDARMDMVSSTSKVKHEAVFKEVHRILRSGGCLDIVDETQYQQKILRALISSGFEITKTCGWEEVMVQRQPLSLATVNVWDERLLIYDEGKIFWIQAQKIR